MQKIPVVAGVVAVAFVLEVGSSGTNTGGACFNRKYKFVSQSFAATTTIHANATFDNKSLPPPPQLSLDVKGTMKIDVDNMNMYEELLQSNSNMNVHAQTIFNAAKQQIVDKVNATITLPSGQQIVVQNCTAMTLSMLPKPWILAQMLKTEVSFFSKRMTCTNDGTYDTWKMNLTLGSDAMGWTEDLQYSVLTNKDYLLHATHAQTKLQVDGVITEAFDVSTMDSDGGVAAAGGPSAADLDYSSWGRCHEVPFNPLYLHSLMSFPHASEESHVHGFRRSHNFRLAMMAIASSIPNFPPSDVVV